MHQRFHTPYITTLVCGFMVALLAASPPSKLAALCNIGTLFAFFVVCLGVFVPALDPAGSGARPFKIPGGKLVSLLGALASLGLMLSMPLDSWLRLLLWLALGLALYFGYGARQSNHTVSA